VSEFAAMMSFIGFWVYFWVFNSPFLFNHINFVIVDSIVYICWLIATFVDMRLSLSYIHPEEKWTWYSIYWWFAKFLCNFL